MICYIVAMDRNRVIGKDNNMPWHLPADLAHFKKVTTGHTVVMGRKTYESIGRPLPNRKNVILTTNTSYEAPGCTIVHTKEEIDRLCKKEQKCFIIGGSELYHLFLSEADRLYVTVIDEAFVGDTYFPEIDHAKWKMISSETGMVDEKNKYPHEYRIYERK